MLIATTLTCKSHTEVLDAWVALAWVKNGGGIHFPSLSDLLGTWHRSLWHRFALLGVAVLCDAYLTFGISMHCWE